MGGGWPFPAAPGPPRRRGARPSPSGGIWRSRVRGAHTRAIVEGRAREAPFVGRAAELARLEAALDRAAAGHPTLVVVGGEAGIGKTFLVAELGRRASARGARLLIGGCLDLGGTGIPYAPFVEALRSLVRDVEPGRLPALLGPGRAELARLLPELAPRGPEPSPGLEGRELARARLFELLLGVLERLGRDAPTVLVVEDLHLADEATRDLLRFLARNLRAVRILVVCTIRTEETGRGHPAAGLLAELEGREGTERIELGRLGRAELAAQLAGLLGRSPAPELVERVLARSDGIPFFAEQVLAAGEQAVDDLSPRLRDIAALSEPTRDVLRIASAAGPRIDDRLLAIVAGLPEPDLFGALRDALACRIIVPVDGADGRAVAFSHALLREAVEVELLPGERIRLHARYAEALLAHPELAGSPSALPAELLHHWEAAGRPERALPAAIEAGRAAERVYAFADASRQYERALALLGRVPPADRPADLDRAELLHHAADCAALAGAYDVAIRRWRDAIALVDPAADPKQAGLLRYRLRWSLWAAGDHAAAVAELDEALRLIPADPPSAERARALAQQGGILMYEGRLEESKAVAEKALVVASAVGATPEAAFALGVLAWDLAGLGEPEQAMALLDSVQAIADAYDRVEGLALAYTHRSAILERMGRLEEALRVARQGIEAVRARGLERTYGTALLANAASVLYALGGWDEADRLTRGALDRQPSGTDAILLHATRGRLLVGRGRFDEAVAELDAARPMSERALVSEYAGRIAAALAELALWRGRPDEALAIVASRVVEAPDARPDPVGLGLACLGLRAAADEAERARAVHDPATLSLALATGDRLLAWVRHDEPLPAGDPGGFAIALCAAEATRLRGPGDPAAWRTAAEACAAAGRPYPAAYGRLREAEALVAAGAGRGPVAAALGEARGPAAALGAGPLLRAVDLLARRIRIELLPSLAGPAAGPAAHGGPGRETGGRPAVDGLGLTPREREVLGLVALGRTNREIAAALFISEKTASVHVTNILAKLGAANRAEAAGIAVRLGLAAEEA